MRNGRCRKDQLPCMKHYTEVKGVLTYYFKFSAFSFILLSLSGGNKWSAVHLYNLCICLGWIRLYNNYVKKIMLLSRLRLNPATLGQQTLPPSRHNLNYIKKTLTGNVTSLWSLGRLVGWVLAGPKFHAHIASGHYFLFNFYYSCITNYLPMYLPWISLSIICRIIFLPVH